MRKFNFCICTLVFAFCILTCGKTAGQGVGINTSGAPANNAAILDVSSTSQGMLIPRMTQAERNNIASPAESLLIYDITTKCFEAYINGSWNTVSCPTGCNPPAAPGAITGISSVCPNTSGLTYSISPVSGATSYMWSGPGDATITPPSPTTSTSITVTFGSNSGNISVTADNACGASSASTLAVTVNPLPTVTVTPNPTAICTGQTATLTETPAEVSYIWNTSATAQSITVSDGNVYSVTVTDGNGCEGVSSGSVTVNTPPIVTVTPNPAAICTGQTATLTETPAEVSYIWNTSATAQSITVSDGNVYSVTVTDGNGCEGVSSGSVTINATGISITAMTATEQSGLAFNVRPANGPNGTVPAGTTYTWSAPTIVPSGSITGGSAQSTGVTYIYGILTNTGTGVPSPAAWAIYSVTPTSGSCVGSPFTVTDTVLQIGSSYNGGVVGYFLTSGQTNGINNYDPNLTHAHGLIFASTYNAQGVFFCSSAISCAEGSSPDGLGNGFGNTATFIANYGTTNYSAPATCYTYGSTPGVWWLPTSAELSLILPNWSLLGGFNTSTCANNEYWSSTGWFNTACGNGGCDAHNVSIPSGCGTGNECSGTSINVRCMRNF